MKYVGIRTQQTSNNMKSMLLLAAFPCIILVLVYAFCAIMGQGSSGSYYYDQYGYGHYVSGGGTDWDSVNEMFVSLIPWVVGIVGVWFCIAYFFNTSMIRRATGAREVTRKDNPRVYNIVENLTMACGMPMPKINVMDTPQLNAFASGIDKDSYTVTVTTGICDRLTDAELAGVIGHELTHIRNRDTRLLIISIIFVGIMSTVAQLTTRFVWNTFAYGGGRNRSYRSRSSQGGKNSGGGIILAMLVAMILAALGYFFTLLTRFAISRKREYMADAGGAELCGDPLALASALRKISNMPASAPEGREDIAQLYIIHPQALTGGITQFLSEAFSTHPSTESRIKYLEQF